MKLCIIILPIIIVYSTMSQNRNDKNATEEPFFFAGVYTNCGYLSPLEIPPYLIKWANNELKSYSATTTGDEIVMGMTMRTFNSSTIYGNFEIGTISPNYDIKIGGGLEICIIKPKTYYYPRGSGYIDLPVSFGFQLINYAVKNNAWSYEIIGRFYLNSYSLGAYIQFSSLAKNSISAGLQIKIIESDNYIIQ